MYIMMNDTIHLDDFKPEQTIVFEEEDGLVCFNSCSHAGVEYVIKEVNKIFPEKKIKAYVGGFHMMGIMGTSTCSYPREEVQNIARKLMEETDACFYSGHCTGTVAYKWMKEILGDRLEYFQTGKVFDL